MTLKVFVNTRSVRAETSALLDCGATENFVHIDYAWKKRLPVKVLATPRKIINVDGTANAQGDIKYYMDLQVQQGKRRVLLRFFLTDIGDRDFILGYPWFAAIQPNIDWARGWIALEQLPVIFRTKDSRQLLLVPRQVNVPRQPPHQTTHLVFVTHPSNARLPKQTLASQLAERHQAKQKPSLPEEYKRHAKVFSEQEAQRFPGPRIWDHAIELEKDAPATIPGRVYALTQSEQKALQEFLTENLKKGYIRPSKSPYASPFFFIKKKDGKLRPVQDYRRVNEWTIRNRYPLPLIPELINRVKGSALFLKFDVCWGYNNVRIKTGDEWKAAFITNEGLFEPRVMFFGLTNSPATFQTMMNAIFAQELREGWVTIYMDDILIHTTDDLPLHRRRVHQILDKLQNHDLYLKPEKCLFEKREMEFLGVVLQNGRIRMDNAKLKGVADWPVPRSVKEVQAFLGFTGFYRYFVPHYSQIARPLIDLTCKAAIFHWETPQMRAFETLKTLMCQRPVLHQPQYDKPFYLATDASGYGVGAVLLQEGEPNPRTKKPMQHPIAYYSATFTPTERNYDIYERELLAVLKALKHWRPHLAATEIPVTVLTDHANLTFWKNPQNVNRRVARWFAFLQDYNLVIKHVPGKLHAAADMLSRPPVQDRGEADNSNLTLLPPSLFLNMTCTIEGSWTELRQNLVSHQQAHQSLMKKWEQSEKASLQEGIWMVQERIVVPPNEELKRTILHRYHDAPTAGHPGRDRTLNTVRRLFWWPDLTSWVTAYVQGCTSCQQNKPQNHPRRTPQFRIPTTANALPFQMIGLDLITQLPPSRGADAILTIVDHGCSRAAIFLPCKTTITGEGVAKLYMEHVYRWFGLPQKIISDRDPQFTSHFARGLTRTLGIQQNVSTTFHPQTDGLTERKNQWVEGYLRHLTAAQQDDWADWLAIATAVHNHHPNATTKIPPIEALMGYQPRLDHQGPPSMNDRAEERTRRAYEAREMACAAINRWAGQTPSPQFKTGDRVWLEAKNLALPYALIKLAPRRVGPFLIVKQVSPVAYQLALPPSWTIHDVFHASLLSPFHHTVQRGQDFPRPPPEMVEGEAEFEVEAIKNHRFYGRQRQLQYLIGWKGYPSADDTWENADQVFAPALIAQYHRHHPLQDKRARSSRRVAIRSSLSCLPVIPPPNLLPPPHPIMNHESWSTSWGSLSTTTASPSQGCASTSKIPMKTHPFLSRLSLMPWNSSAPHLSRPVQPSSCFSLKEREEHLKHIVRWLRDLLTQSSHDQHSSKPSNVTKPPPWTKSDSVLPLLLGRTCGDFQQSLRSLTPHQMRIYQLIKQYRGRQLLTWWRSIGQGSASRLATCATRTTSLASSSLPPSNAAAPPLPSSRPPSSDAPHVTPSSLKGPPTGSSSTPPRCTPLLENRIGPSTPYPLGSSLSCTPHHLIIASSSSTATGRETGGWAESSPATTCSRSKSPEFEITSIDGRRSSKRSRPVEIEVGSALNRHELGSDSKRWKGSWTPVMGIGRRHSRFSPSPEVIPIDPPLTLNVGGCGGAKGGPHASRRVMTPASASRASRG